MLPVRRADLLQDAPDPVRRVDRRLQPLVDLFAREDRQGVGRLVEELLDQAAAQDVALLLDGMDPGRVGTQFDRPRERADPLDDDVARVDQERRLIDRPRWRDRHVIEHEHVADLLGEIDDVVEDPGQEVDVLAFERDDEGRLEVVQDGVIDVVALMLQLPKPVGRGRRIGVVTQPVFEHPGTLGGDGGLLQEELVELLVRRDQPEGHRMDPGMWCMPPAYGVAPPDAPPHGIIWSMRDLPGYELLDLGGGARLERFGDRVVDRPAPAALEARADPRAWAAADLRFDRDRGWTGPGAGDGAWQLETGDLTLELRPTEAGQVGLFPEHAAMLPWLRDRGLASVLHLFAYTGLVTLSLARLGVAVTHVDSSRPAVGWARRNAELSGLVDRPIRWIVDDARAFVAREARRGRRYDGVVLDPPSYGHGPSGGSWRLEEDLADLLSAVHGVLEPRGSVLVTAHTPGFGPERLATGLAAGLARPPRSVDSGDLAIDAADGRRLVLGAFARVGGEA